MISIDAYFSEKSILSNTLDTHGHYWAHLPPSNEMGIDPETLFEHCELVCDYFKKLCEAHHLEKVIDALIEKSISISHALSTQDKIRDFVKALFLNVIVFHDFGKVNENYQALRMKNIGSFKENRNLSLVPSYGHSFLGAYIFIAYHLEKLVGLELEATEEEKLAVLIYSMSYPILCHHKSCIGNPKVSLDRSDLDKWFPELKKYLALYKISFDVEMSDYFLRDEFENQWNVFWDNDKKNACSIFALIKLSFSLLTASDYLATHEYMSGEKTVDFGTFSNRDRIKEIIVNVRSTHKHNRDTFLKLNYFEFNEINLRERSTENLNKLRQEMAVELIRTIRLNNDRRLFYIEAPTGGGKTNLSMIALTELMEANPELNKVYYVFPFTSLITQTYKALKETLVLKEDELVELHSKAGFHSKISNEEEQKDGEYGSAKKDFIDNLFALYPLTVLSHIRFFDVLKTNRKDSNYLLYRFANSIVIIDELQTYNPKIWDKMLYLIDEYSKAFNMRFILMSATLPKISDLQLPGFKRPEFVDLLPNARAYISNPNFSERVQFNFELFDHHELKINELAEIVSEKSQLYAAQYGRVHTIVEFIYKKSASEFRQVISELPTTFDHIFVLSGTVLESQRRLIISFLKDIKNRSSNILLITTQVVEAGVDIDMDLGFKNISLIDSDEQLAGRVNRNASKDNCEVYLFRIDDPELLYKGDDRYKVTKEGINRQEYACILRDKSFKTLYELVFKRRDNYNNNSGWADNFQNDFLDPGINKLDFKIVDEKFKIIDQKNESVFAPIALPVQLENGEIIFSDTDLQFLKLLNGYQDQDDFVKGQEVWRIYQNMILQSMENRKKRSGFDLSALIQFKTIQSIMCKFTFSLFSHSKTVEKIKSLGFGVEQYGFLFLNGPDKDIERIYSLDGGLNEAELNNDNENLFL